MNVKPDNLKSATIEAQRRTPIPRCVDGPKLNSTGKCQTITEVTMIHDNRSSKLTRSSLAAILVAFAISLSWSGICIAADAVTPENLTAAVANAKTPQNYEALAAYYEGQANDAKQKAGQIKAQYSAIYAPSGLRTGADQEEIQQWGIFTKMSTSHYLGLAQQDTNLAKMYRRKSNSAGSQ
jgi:hypothetical protein